jgi:hypothetical protein
VRCGCEGTFLNPPGTLAFTRAARRFAAAIAAAAASADASHA